MVGLSTGESPNRAGGVIHTLTAGGTSVTVHECSHVRVCSHAFLPEHGQGVPLTAHVSSNILGETGYWHDKRVEDQWFSTRLSCKTALFVVAIMAHLCISSICNIAVED